MRGPRKCSPRAASDPAQRVVHRGESRREGGQVASDGAGNVVYRALREEIVLGRLRPNELISEVELATRLRVSRTPVREALQRLASDGLIRSYKRRWIVHQHSLDEIREIYEIRAALEGQAARLAAVRATDETLAELEQQVHNRPLSVDHGDQVMVQTNNEFHRRIVEAAGNGRLQELVEASRRYFFNSQVALLYRETDIRESQGQHVALLEALTARDPEAAESIVRDHIEHAFRIIESRLAAGTSSLLPSS